MKISNTGLNLIKKYESLRLTAYKDSVGVWTIGYGHTLGVLPGMIITSSTADSYLRKDVELVENALNKYNFKLSQNQFDALVSLFFNVGTGNIKNFTTLLRNDPNSEQVPEKIKKYVYAGGKILNGLVRRRAEEAELYKKKVRLSNSLIIVFFIVIVSLVIYIIQRKIK